MLIGEQATAGTDHHRKDEQPQLVDRAHLQKLLGQGNASGQHDVGTLASFEPVDLRNESLATAKDGRLGPSGIFQASRHDVLLHPIQVIGDPVLSSTCLGQNPRISSKVVRPTRKPSERPAC